MTRRSRRSRPPPKTRVHLAGSAMACPCHVCAFFHNAEEEYRVLLPFMREGYERGDRAVHVLDKNHRNERLRRLTLGGVDVDSAQASGQLEIEIWESAYLRKGQFNQRDMLDFVQESLTSGIKSGFARTRLWANMEWALAEVPGVQDIAEYESRLNYVLPLYQDAVVCAFDVSRFPAAVLEDVLRAHPYVLADGLVQENSRYVHPDHLLKEFESRQS